MKTLIFLLFVPMAALATTPHPPPTPEHEPQTQGQAQDQRQGQDQSQVQDQDQYQDQSQVMGDQENSQVVNFSSPDDITIRNVASPNPPSVMGSHSCATGASAGLALAGVAVSGGKQKISEPCEVRETARLLHAFGERELAVVLVCTTPGAAALGDACGPSVTQEELRRRIDFLLKEMEIDRQKCNESKDHILEGCMK